MQRLGVGYIGWVEEGPILVSVLRPNVLIRPKAQLFFSALRPNEICIFRTLTQFIFYCTDCGPIFLQLYGLRPNVFLPDHTFCPPRIG